MKFIKLAILIGFPILGGIYCYQFTGQSRDVVVPFQTFRAPESLLAKGGVGAPVALQLREPVTIVSFWATWCPPCVEEFPALIELQRQLEGKGVEIVFVNIDEKWESVGAFFLKHGIQVRPDRLYWDSKKEVAAKWGTTRFPETYVVRRDGWVVEKIIGAQLWTRPVVLRYFSDLGKKFESIPGVKTAALLEPTRNPLKTLWEALIPSARADGPQAVHEEDKKNLERLKQNVEMAAQNEKTVEASLGEEKKNLEQLKLKSAQIETQKKKMKAERDDADHKLSDAQKALQGQRGSLSQEKNQLNQIDKKMKSNAEEIKRLEQEIAKRKDEESRLRNEIQSAQQNVDIATRGVSTLEHEVEVLNNQLKYLGTNYKETESQSSANSQAISSLNQKVHDLERKLGEQKKVLEDQKEKLEKFQKLVE